MLAFNVILGATASVDVVVTDMIVAALHHKGRSRKGAQLKTTRRARGLNLLRSVD